MAESLGHLTACVSAAGPAEARACLKGRAFGGGRTAMATPAANAC